MAQMQRERDVSATATEEGVHERAAASGGGESAKNTSGSTSSGAAANFKFNVQAPEFVPRSVPVPGYFYPYLQYQDWIYVGNSQVSSPLYSTPNVGPNSQYQKIPIPDEVKHKIIKQVEYQLSDMSLLANENLAKQMSKDPEGYVPISSVASTKKIKSLLSGSTSNEVLTQALQYSTKLIVSNDGKKVKRRHPFTDKDKEELQCRTVVAENLPDDHSHHNIEKIFNVVGSVKTIRICHPQDPNSSRTKGEYFISNKLHALVEFESPEIAEKAAEKLNDERNWRKGLRVKMLLRRSPRSVLKSRKSEFEGCLEDDDQGSPTAEDSSHHLNRSESVDTNGEEGSSSSATCKKGWGKGRGKARTTRVLTHGGGGSGRGLLPLSPQCSTETPAKQASKGPRMPDGTRGFTMGRGKPLAAAAAAGVPCI
ncbi:hypothetical protein DM860_015216 [Cuscuta australis]|uniref:HTH La-type RNA-binding domain-containing protein n=1 Tax=Cuscuta australis TaxID=267555 RepID=A0A328CZF2_9ASTE|nr:hypothetical protein DM860_015216 [Cuscuta australis]